MKLRASEGTFGLLLASAEDFWGRLTSSDGRRIILVDAMSQDVRVQLRQLTVANVLRSIEPADLVAVTGPDRLWVDSIWPEDFDSDLAREMARSFGATDTIDLDASLVSETGERQTVRPSIRGVVCPPLDEISPVVDGASLDRISEATACRILKVPRLDPEDAVHCSFSRRMRSRSESIARLYSWLFGSFEVVALVTSHVDYHQWGLAVETAVASRVPVLHTQATGGVKAFSWFPGSAVSNSVRENTTLLTAGLFEQHVWSNRQALLPHAELATRRNRDNMGRPAWWRGAGPKLIEIGSAAERHRLRQLVASRYGLDADVPIVGVFAHAVSDALGTNHSVEDDLARWIERVAQFATDHPEVNWLFFDHPNQALYDVTDNFHWLANQYGSFAHIHFMSSADLTKNAQLSLVDLGLTVRGSIGNEYPAFGIPVVQAGWSEFSHCGIGARADSLPEYWGLLTESIERLARGERLITDDEIKRARLWLWFYRSMSDVVTSLVPDWHLGDAETGVRAAATALRHIEPDCDPLFAAMRRMWTRRDVAMLRVDLADPTWIPIYPRPRGTRVVKRKTSVPLTDRERAIRLETDFDQVRPHAMPVLIGGGTSSLVRIADGLDRGGKGVGRCVDQEVILGLDVDRPTEPVGVVIHLRLGHLGRKVWRDRSPQDFVDETRGRRGPMRRLLTFGTDNHFVALMMPPERNVVDGPVTVSAILSVGPAAFVDGVVLLKLGEASADTRAFAPNQLLPWPVLGLMIESLVIVSNHAHGGPTLGVANSAGSSLDLGMAVLPAVPHGGPMLARFRNRGAQSVIGSDGRRRRRPSSQPPMPVTMSGIDVVTGAACSVSGQIDGGDLVACIPATFGSPVLVKTSKESMELLGPQAWDLVEIGRGVG